jgi:UrcA family protein
MAFAVTAGSLSLVATSSLARGPIVITGPSPDELVTRRVSYADLDLTSTVGEKALVSRVRTAVKSLCVDATRFSDGMINHRFDEVACFASARRQTTPQIATAVQRARDIALNGTSNLDATAIAISLPE